MGFFSNGTEGELYEAEYCERCIHYGDEDGPGCAVWSVHLLFNSTAGIQAAQVLNTLIPRSQHGDNEQCRMFIAAPLDAA